MNPKRRKGLLLGVATVVLAIICGDWLWRNAVEGPTEFQGNIFASINQRRGIIHASSEDGAFSRVEAEVPLSEMFGYSTVLRSLTQGKAEFTMEFLKYGRVTNSISE